MFLWPMSIPADFCQGQNKEMHLKNKSAQNRPSSKTDHAMTKVWLCCRKSHKATLTKSDMCRKMTRRYSQLDFPLNHVSVNNLEKHYLTLVYTVWHKPNTAYYTLGKPLQSSVVVAKSHPQDVIVQQGSKKTPNKTGRQKTEAKILYLNT